MSKNICKLKWTRVSVIIIVICMAVGSVKCTEAENVFSDSNPEVDELQASPENDNFMEENAHDITGGGRGTEITSSMGENVAGSHTSTNQEISSPSGNYSSQLPSSPQPSMPGVVPYQPNNRSNRKFQKSSYFYSTSLYPDNKTVDAHQPLEKLSSPAEGVPPAEPSTEQDFQPVQLGKSSPPQNFTHQSYSFSFSNSNKTDWDSFDEEPGAPPQQHGSSSFQPPPQQQQPYPPMQFHHRPYFYPYPSSGFQQNQGPPAPEQVPASEQRHYGQQPNHFYPYAFGR